MKDFPVAIQLFSLREEVSKDFYGTLKKVKEMGYDGVEFAGLAGKNADEVKAWCDELGLTPISAHIPFESMLNDTTVLDTYAKIGCKFAVIPYALEKHRPGGENFDEFLEGVKLLAVKAHSLGMTLAYHNHNFEFEKLDGKYKLDILYELLPKNFLETQLDTCWVNVGGENPVDYINKYSDRANILHLKDFVGGKTENMFELIGIEGEKKKAEPQKFEFRPVGHGVQNFPAILEAAKEVGVKWVVVEQDNPCLDLTPLECAKMSIEYLNSL